MKFNPLSILGFDVTGPASVNAVVADAAARLALTPTVDGYLVFQNDSDVLYAFQLGSSTWTAISGATSVLSIGSFQSSSTANGLSISGNDVRLHAADASNPGALTTSAQSIAGDKTFSGLIGANGNIDRTAAGTLTIGGTNATNITIGNAGATTTIVGVTYNNQVTNYQVTDGLITLNKGGSAGSAVGSGFELEEDSLITSYIKTSGDRNSYIVKAPNTAGVITLTPGVSGFTIDQGSHNPVTLGTANGLSLSTQQLSLATASAGTTGALTSADWSTFNSKEPAITVGTSSQYWRGDKTFQELTASAVKLQTFATATHDTVQKMQNVYHSAGWVSGGEITDNLDGTIAVAAGTGFLRATDSNLVALLPADWSANASVSLTNNSDNFVYIDYNGGAPIVGVTTSRPSDRNTKILLANVFRSGTNLDINVTERATIADHAGLMIAFNKAVMPYARESGCSISATGTRNFALTSGVFWNGLTRFSTNAFDSSVASTFTYVYRNGVGGFTEVAAQTQINNTQYDDGDGTLGTLTNNRFGVHWVFQTTDNEVFVLYGQGDYTLTQAQDSEVPADIPPRIASHGFLVGRIIIEKSAAVFTSTESAFAMGFTASQPTQHNSLLGLQGGQASEYYHLTATQHSDLTNQSTNLKTTGTPTFASQTLNAASNQLTLGSGNTVIINAQTISSSYTLRLPTAVAAVNSSALISDTSGNLTYSRHVAASIGDITETSYNSLTDVVTNESITGFAFANGSVRSFRALVSCVVDAGTDNFATYDIQGIQKASDWVISYSRTGDDQGITFSITAAGQIQYTSITTGSFSSRTFKFRAETTSV